MGYEDEKKAINEEGWEGNAAVLIGKEKELKVLRERLEKEGKAADLGTYIRMHKQVVLSSEDPEMEKLKGVVENARGLVFEQYLTSPDGSEIRYVDQNGNIARVNIDAGKIAAYQEILGSEEGRGQRWHDARYSHELEERLESALRGDLKELGFSGEYVSLSESEMFGDRGNGTAEGKKLIELVKDLSSRFRAAFDAKKKRLEKEARERRTREFDL